MCAININRLSVPETGEVVIVYARRNPFMTRWHGGMIVRNGDDTTAAHSGPQTTPQDAVTAVAAHAPLTISAD